MQVVTNVIFGFFIGSTWVLCILILVELKRQRREMS